MKSKHKCELFFSTYEEWSKWKKALRKLVLVSDYKNVYKNCKIIPKGQKESVSYLKNYSYFKVSLCNK